MEGSKEIKLLVIDDHPLIIEGYKEVLTRLGPKDIRFDIDSAHTCDLGWTKITTTNYDVVMLDMSFPKYENNRFNSGEDLGEKIKEEYPALKIIILTQIEDSFHLGNIMHKIKPEGFLLKRETNPGLLADCIKSVIDDIPFYSPKIARILQLGKGTDSPITEHDRIILYQLSLGTKTKDLQNYLPLSFRAIEDRKRRLKEYFRASDDRTLLAKAREQGYV